MWQSPERGYSLPGEVFRQRVRQRGCGPFVPVYGTVAVCLVDFDLRLAFSVAIAWEDVNVTLGGFRI